MTPEQRYEGLSCDELVERLSAAEDVCLMFGWSAAHEDTDRDIATYELWSRWHDLAGAFATRRNHPHLSDKAIEPMIREYVERRDKFRTRSVVVDKP